MSLLHEIQNELAMGASDIKKVLLKCKILAARLGSEEFAQWINWELNGYPDGEPIPQYRHLTITYYASFTDMAWRVPQAAVPLQVVPEKYRDAFKEIEFKEGIAKAVSLSQGNGTIGVEKPELIFVLQGKMYPRMNCQRVWGQISHIEFEQLVSAVASRILDFSLKIEAEDPNAGEASPNAHPIPSEKLRPLVQNVFYGNVGAVAQNSEYFSQSVAMDLSLSTLSKLVTELTSHLGDLRLDQRQEQRVRAQIETLRAEATGDPDPMIVRQAAQTLRNITEGAIGSLLAAAVQPTIWHWIQQTIASLSR